MAQEDTNKEEIMTEENPATELSRREFIKQAGAGVIALTAVGVGLANLGRKSPTHELQISSGVVMPDPSLCIGCLTCEVICSNVHRDQGLSDVPRIRIFNDLNIVVDQIIIDEYGDRGQYHQSPCLQCPDAPCLFVCPADSLVVEPSSGARIIDEEKCIACGRCENACAFPTISESEATGREVLGQRSRITYDPTRDIYVKCDLCYWRPEGPACVERCPINIRINQGIIESDNMCLSLPEADRAHWEVQNELEKSF